MLLSTLHDDGKISSSPHSFEWEHLCSVNESAEEEKSKEETRTRSGNSSMRAQSREIWVCAADVLLLLLACFLPLMILAFSSLSLSLFDCYIFFSIMLMLTITSLSMMAVEKEVLWQTTDFLSASSNRLNLCVWCVFPHESSKQREWASEEKLIIEVISHIKIIKCECQRRKITP
jgi:hypothetical protein